MSLTRQVATDDTLPSSPAEAKPRGRGSRAGGTPLLALLPSPFGLAGVTDRDASKAELRSPYWLTHMMRAIQAISDTVKLRSPWAALSEVSSTVRLVWRFSSLAMISPSVLA